MKQQLTLIGQKLYPKDNSYQFNIATKESSMLAGTYNSDAKEVEIISEPYKLKTEVGLWGELVKYLEYVTVLCEGQSYVCLNNFETYEEMIARRELNRELDYHNQI